ncbi:unnamed protein product [Camellia sinensis]
MNKETQRLSKIPNEVRGEIGTFFVDSPPVMDEDSRKLPKLDESTADYIRNGLTPRWSDLDVNQHVNNVKYIGRILEHSWAMCSNYEISAKSDYNFEKPFLHLARKLAGHEAELAAAASQPLPDDDGDAFD